MYFKVFPPYISYLPSVNIHALYKSRGFLHSGPFCSCTTYQTCSPTLKAELLVQKLSPHFQKATLLSAFLTWSQFPSILASLSKPGRLPAVGSGRGRRGRRGRRSRRRRRRKKRHLKLNLKMCFSWKPGCAAINQGRHFHAPHFSWFLSEFPPFLSHSTLAPELPTAALAADHSQRGTVGWPVPPSRPEQ